MANIPLKDITFPGLSDTYTVPQIDSGLNTSGKAADSKATGDALALKVPKSDIDTTLSTTGKVADAKAAGDAIAAAEGHVGTLSNLTTTAKTSAVAAVNELDADMETKAEIDGAYESMTVGNAEQLVSTVFTDDNEPYNFRTAGGNADIGDRLYEKIVGGTVAWNQLAKALVEGNYNKGLGTAVYDNGTVSFTAAARYGALYGATLMPLVVAHKYLINADIRLTNATTINAVRIAIGNTGYNQGAVYVPETTPTIVFTNVSGVVAYNPGENPTNNYLFLQDNRAEVSQIDMKNLMLIDLTAMFGTTIADYIYGLETANAGDGVAWFKKLFPKDYYAYDAGSLQSVQAAKHVTVGFNQFDNSNLDNLTAISKVGDHWTGTVANWITTNGGTGSAGWENIRYIDGAQYCISMRGTLSSIGTTNVKIQARYTDGTTSQSFNDVIPQGETKTIHLVTTAGKTLSTFFITYGSGTTATLDVYWINVNLHWDGERDGEYEEYVKHEYPLADITLRGIPKLDASNHLYYDGDTYEPDGTVTRKYGIVDLGTLTWAAASAYGSVYRSDAQVDAPKNDNPTTGYYAPMIISSLSLKHSLYVADAAANATAGLIGIRYNKIYVTFAESKTAAEVKTALNGIYVLYELATPTTESAAAFQSPQVVDDFGTEEYVDAGVTASTPTRDVAIPVGHESQYSANLRAKLEMAPDSPSDGDGDYLVRQTSGQNEYVKYVSPVPALPSEDGTYSLKCTVSGSTKTVAWVADE